MQSPNFNFFPDHLSGESKWLGHLPFAYDLVGILKPEKLADIGTRTGDSFLTFCQAVHEHKLKTLCYSIPCSREQHYFPRHELIWQQFIERVHSKYSSFAYLSSKNIHSEPEFNEQSLDLVHFCPLEGHASISQLFDLWVTRVKDGGVVLIHGIHDRSSLNPVSTALWKFWDEISPQYASWTFPHGGGLGIIIKGENPELSHWLEKSIHSDWSDYYIGRGRDLDRIAEIFPLKREIQEQSEEIATLKKYKAKSDLLESKLRDSEIRIREKESTLKDFENQVRNLQKGLHQPNAEVLGSSTEVELGLAQNHVRDVKPSTTLLSEPDSISNAKLCQLENEYRNALKKQAQENQSLVSDLQHKLQQATSELQHIKSKLKALEQSNTTDKTEKDRLLRLKRTEIELLTAKLRELFAKAKQKQALIQELKKELKEAVAQKKRIKRQVHDWNSRSWFTRAFHRLRLRE